MALVRGPIFSFQDGNLCLPSYFRDRFPILANLNLPPIHPQPSTTTMARDFYLIIDPSWTKKLCLFSLSPSHHIAYFNMGRVVQKE